MHVHLAPLGPSRMAEIMEGGLRSSFRQMDQYRKFNQGTEKSDFSLEMNMMLDILVALSMLKTYQHTR